MHVWEHLLWIRQLMKDPVHKKDYGTFEHAHDRQ